MSSTTLKGFKDEIDFSKINISSLRKLDSGGHMAGVHYIHNDLKKPFVIQTPNMEIPYDFGKGYNGDRSDNLNLSMGDYKSDKRLKMFYDNIKNIEEAVVQHVVNNVETWFPNYVGKEKSITEQLIREAFNRFIKHSKEDKYPPTIKVKIPYKDDKYSISVTDMNDSSKEYDFNTIKDKLKGAQVKICFRITSVYFINKHFGFTGSASKIKIMFPSRDEDDFRSDSEDEDSIAKKMTSVVIEDDEIDPEIRKEFEKKSAKQSVDPVDSEEEEDEEEDKKEDKDDEEEDDDEEDDDEKDEKPKEKPKKSKDSDDDDDDSDDEPVKKPTVKKTVVKSKATKKK